MAKARSVVDVLLGEAVSGTKPERYKDMLAIASVIVNRAAMLGVSPEDVVGDRREFNAFGKDLPPGVEKFRELAQEALQEVKTAGPVNNATFYATPATVGNLPDGLKFVAETKGHRFATDPQMRSIRTAQGFKRPVPSRLLPDDGPMPVFRPKGLLDAPDGPGDASGGLLAYRGPDSGGGSAVDAIERAADGAGTAKARAEGNGVKTTGKDPYDIAATLIGKGERPDNSTLREFMANGGQNLDPATTAWCAAYVNASLDQAGIEGTDKLNARSYLDWGEPVEKPQKGDIAVFSRGDPNGWQGHVGFFDSFADDGRINVLGGNQGDRVSISPYSADRLLGFRRAPGEQGMTPASAYMPDMPAGSAQIAGVPPVTGAEPMNPELYNRIDQFLSAPPEPQADPWGGMRQPEAPQLQAPQQEQQRQGIRVPQWAGRVAGGLLGGMVGGPLGGMAGGLLGGKLAGGGLGGGLGGLLGRGGGGGDPSSGGMRPETRRMADTLGAVFGLGLVGPGGLATPGWSRPEPPDRWPGAPPQRTFSPAERFQMTGRSPAELQRAEEGLSDRARESASRGRGGLY